jgi:pimeloyl-ACP methyl ester carboxylesterase
MGRRRRVVSGSVARLVASVMAVWTSVPLADAETRVSLLSADGVTIAGTYYEPSRRPAAMVLLLHMPTRSRADWAPLAERFAERGVGALAIDFRGHGESGALPPADPTTPVARPAEVRDIQAALTWLKQRSEALPGRIGIVGASLGANLAILVAAEDTSIRALVLLSATLDFRGVRTEGALRKYGDRAALLVTSQDDGYATRSARELSAVGSGPREVHLLDGAGHGTMMLRRQADLVSTVVDWLCSRLL